jgi:hypothetical protein
MFVALDERDGHMWCRMSKEDVCSYGRLREVFVALDDQKSIFKIFSSNTWPNVCEY